MSPLNVLFLVLGVLCGGMAVQWKLRPTHHSNGLFFVTLAGIVAISAVIGAKAS